MQHSEMKKSLEKHPVPHLHQGDAGREGCEKEKFERKMFPQSEEPGADPAGRVQL